MSTIDPSPTPVDPQRERRKHLAAIFAAVSFYLGIFALLPYSLGNVADVLPPVVKKWVTILGLAIAALTDFVRRVLVYLDSK